MNALRVVESLARTMVCGMEISWGDKTDREFVVSWFMVFFGDMRGMRMVL